MATEYLEDWESGLDEEDITILNTLATQVLKAGASTAKFDNSVDPYPGSSMAARLQGGGTFASCLMYFDLASIQPYFDLEFYFRMNSLGSFYYPNLDPLLGSLHRAPIAIGIREAGLTVGNIYFGGDIGNGGLIDTLIGNTAPYHRVIKADGTLSDETHDFLNDGQPFFAAGIDYKVRVAGDLTGWNVWINDVLINSVSLPWRNTPSVGFDNLYVGVLRHTDFSWLGNLRWVDDQNIFGPAPDYEGGVGGGFEPFLDGGL